VDISARDFEASIEAPLPRGGDSRGCAGAMRDSDASGVRDRGIAYLPISGEPMLSEYHKCAPLMAAAVMGQIDVRAEEEATQP